MPFAAASRSTDNGDVGREPRRSQEFVGRAAELAELTAAVEEARAGHGRLYLISGDPGIGKSRIAEEIMTVAQAGGARTLWGRCWEAGGAPPYWPWVQSLRAYVRDADANELQRVLGAGAADIAQLLPEIRAAIPQVGEITAADTEDARFRLFDSMSTLLHAMSRQELVVLVLEDVHAADTPSLILLNYLADVIPDMRIVIIATYRDVELRRNHALAAALVEMARAPGTRRMHLGGLSAREVGRYIESASGVAPRAGTVDAIASQTDGNPLFVGEIVRLLVSQGRISGSDVAFTPIPQGIREVVLRRFALVSPQCKDLLGIASVLGREFRVDVLAELAEMTAESALQSVDEAVDARLVTESPGALGAVRFLHSLIRDTLYESLSASERSRLHRRAGEVLAGRWGDRPDHLAELAHHFLAAALTADAQRAIDYSIRAGDVARSRLAFEEAARLYELALQAIDLETTQNDRLLFDVLLSLGDVLSRAGDAGAARVRFLEAVDIARKHGDAEGMARAVLGYGGRFPWRVMRGDKIFLPLVKEALAALGDARTRVRAQLLGRLAAGPLRDDPDSSERLQLSEEGVVLARELDDPATLAYTIEARMIAILGPESSDEVGPLANELVALGTRIGDGERVIGAHNFRLADALLHGDMDAATRERRRMAALTEELRQPPQRWFLLATDAELALLQGQFTDAERLASEALAAGERAEEFAPFAYALQMLVLRIEQDRAMEMDGLFSSSIDGFRIYPIWRAALPYFLTRFARVPEAYRAVADATRMQRPVNEDWLLGEGLLAEAVAILAIRDEAETMYGELLPHADLTIGGIPNVNVGSAQRPLGRLAAVLDRIEDAERHLHIAIEANDAMGAAPWAAHSRYQLARLLLRRNRTNDRSAAQRLLNETIEACERCGMVALGTTARRLVAGESDTTPAVRTPETPRRHDATEGVFEAEGEYWTVVYAGHVSRLRDSKGMRVLAVLLAAPGRPHPSLDLERLGEAGDLATVRVLAHADAGELLDDEARTAYRARLSELDVEIEEALEAGSPDEAGRLREEKDFLIRELARAVGIGGRSRRAGSVADRARLNVTRAVRSALRRIGETDPDLAAHLEATVHTGTVCVYRPDPRSQLRWRTPQVATRP